MPPLFYIVLMCKAGLFLESHLNEIGEFMKNTRFKKILYATDLGRNSHIALDVAMNIAASTQAKLIFMHVINNMDIEQDEAIESYISDALFKQIRKSKQGLAAEKIERRLAEIKDENPALFASIEIERVITEGPVTAQILTLVEEQSVDMIVIGSRTHSTLGELLIGSTASKVVHRSKVPVTVVPL